MKEAEQAALELALAPGTGARPLVEEVEEPARAAAALAPERIHPIVQVRHAYQPPAQRVVEGDLERRPVAHAGQVDKGARRPGARDPIGEAGVPTSQLDDSVHEDLSHARGPPRPDADLGSGFDAHQLVKEAGAEVRHGRTVTGRQAGSQQCLVPGRRVAGEAVHARIHANEPSLGQAML